VLHFLDLAIEPLLGFAQGRRVPGLVLAFRKPPINQVAERVVQREVQAVAHRLHLFQPLGGAVGGDQRQHTAVKQDAQGGKLGGGDALGQRLKGLMVFRLQGLAGGFLDQLQAAGGIICGQQEARGQVQLVLGKTLGLAEA